MSQPEQTDIEQAQNTTAAVPTDALDSQQGTVTMRTQELIKALPDLVIDERESR